MTEPKWTPGPWETVSSHLEVYAFIDGKPVHIATANANELDGGFREAIANLNVMCAAPEYDELLGEAIDLIRGDLVGAEWKRACSEFVAKAKGLRTKARGETE